jgi:hypothetical protein
MCGSKVISMCGSKKNHMRHLWLGFFSLVLDWLGLDWLG